VEALPFTLFRQDVLLDLLQIANPLQESPLRKEYLKARDGLWPKVKSGGGSPADRINLGYYLIRLRQYEDALGVLVGGARQERRPDFRLLANLATAYQHTGQFREAREYLGLARDDWPQECPPIPPEQLKWYRKAEALHRKLVILRSKETLGQPSGKAKPPEAVDDLFEVRFVGDSGLYEAGKIAAAEQQKLPPDAVALVQQLLVWLPEDTRLYWLLGEVLNAKGDVAGAEKIFEDCLWSRGLSAPALREHRQVLLAALPQPEAPPGEWAPDSRRLEVVLGLAGLLILVLGYWQVRQLFRRRAAAR
jgi:tetratricopeptide (TPR) repeat protein